ncbi:MAG: ABC transporter permease, partial [Lachnospiraceae bacterium]|nr:ABC transporter permease [Lachnospiraceae bacterium]
VLVTKSFAEKFSLEVDETVVLKEEFTDKTYDFRIDGLYDMPGTLGVLMPLDEFNRTFGNEEGSFTGYLSDTPITDIDDDLIAADITAEDVLRVVQQLDHSLGGYMTYFEVVCILIAVVIIYLLTKLMVERNAVSISMAKVLGYTAREINGLYIRITTGVVVVSAIAGLFLSIAIMSKVWQIIMYRFNGWFAFDVNDYDMLKMLLMTLISYGVVVLFDMRRVRRIPLTEALKNVE